MTKMILFLDDNPNRAVITHRRMTESERNRVIWCKTVEEAICTLWDYRERLERVMLDHDLGGQQYVNTKREDCGMEVIRYLERLSRKEPKEFDKLKAARFVVHSWNDHAGPQMVERLRKIGLTAYYNPFDL